MEQQRTSAPPTWVLNAAVNDVLGVVAKADDVKFMPSHSFSGRKAGYYYSLGPQGLGCGQDWGRGGEPCLLFADGLGYEGGGLAVCDVATL